MPQNNDALLVPVKLIFFDVDGTLTDGRLIYDHEGRESKAFFARDGSRMTLAMKAGVKIFFITTDPSPAVLARAKNRKIEGVLYKKDFEVASLTDFFAKQGVTASEVLYMGDDTNDLPFMKLAGVRVAVADAAEEVKKAAHIITNLEGGRGAAAEILERVLKAKGQWSFE